MQRVYRRIFKRKLKPMTEYMCFELENSVKVCSLLAQVGLPVISYSIEQRIYKCGSIWISLLCMLKFLISTK